MKTKNTNHSDTSHTLTLDVYCQLAKNASKRIKRTNKNTTLGPKFGQELI
jgi:hypothetical protein